MTRASPPVGLGAFKVSASAVENVERSLDAIHALDRKVRAFVDVDADGARLAALEADRLPLEKHGPLHGVPVAIKEIFDVAGLRCSWGTAIHAARRPECDSPIVRKLKEAGAIVVGTVVSSEYAVASSSKTRNPWDLSRTAGVSSSGSAASVAAGMVPLSIGSQTIGSTIRPASYCGVMGLKPTHGLIPLDGTMPLSAPLDHIGIFAVQPEILKRCLGALSGAPTREKSFQSLSPDRTTVHVVEGWSDDVWSEAVARAVGDAADQLSTKGYEVRSRKLPSCVADEKDVLMSILCHDMAIHHAGDFEQHAALMGPRVRSMILDGQAISRTNYEEHLDSQEEISSALSDAIEKHDVYLTASVATAAPRSEDGAGSRITQRLWTLSGLPALSVPFAAENGLPIGVQLIAQNGNEWQLVDLAKQLDRGS